MKNNFQSKAVPRGTRTIWRYLSALILLLTLAIGNVWGTDIEIPLTNLKNFPLDYGLVKITNTENTTIGSNQLQVSKKTAKFKVSTTLAGFYLKSISFTDANSSKNGGFTCDEGSYMSGPTENVYTYTAPNTTTTEANFSLIGSGGTAKMGTIIVTLSTNEQVERLTAFGSVSDSKIPFTSSAATSNVELSVPASNAVSTSSSRISIGSGGKHLIVSTKNSKVLKNIIIPKYQQSTYEITGSSDPAGTYNKTTNVWTPTAATNTSVDLTLTVSSTVYSQEIFVIYSNAASYTITYDANDGEGTMENSTNTVSACTFTAPTGKEFKEWNTLATGLGDSYDPGDAASSDLDLFAIWQTKVEKFTVKYMDGTTELGSEVVEVGQHPTGSEIADPTKDCYTFAGWDPALSGVSGSDGDEVVVNATWTPNYAFGAYSFVNVSEVGTAPNKLTMSDGNTVNVPAGSRVDNFYFSAMAIKYESGASTALTDYKGWKINTKDATIKFLVENNSQVKVAIGSKDAINVTYTEPDGTAKNAISQGQQTEVSYLAKAGTLFTIKTATANTTTLKRITISPLYNATYTTSKSSVDPTSASNVAEVTLPTPNETTVGGYSFTGWIANQTVYKGETAKTAGEGLDAGETYTLTDNTAFTAQWQLISDFDVKFFQGYGDPDVQIGETQSISTGNYATAPDDPTRTGYAFLGWSYDATEAHIVDVASYAITAATNFTAMWKAVWAVTFDGAGNVIVEDGEAVASPDSPTQAGKVFQGWYNGESKYDFSAAVTGALTLTSKWVDADPNHFVYAYNDDFHFDGVVYKTPEGKVDNNDLTSNKAITTPYTLFSGAGGITSIVATGAIYDSKGTHVNAFLKLDTKASSYLTVTIASGYTAVMKVKMGSWNVGSAAPTVTFVDEDDTPVSYTGTMEGKAEDNNYAELTYNLSAGTYKMTTATKTLYFSNMDIEATALPTHTVTYKAGEGTGDDVVDADATNVADVPSTFTAPTGQVFNGWKDELDNDVEVGAIVSADMALTAQWINHYAVTFNMNGHGGDAPAAQDIKEGAKATKPADPIAIGWDFGGWFTDAECTAGNEFDFNTPITVTTPLFAKWTAFDGCAVLVPAISGSTLNAGDAVDLQTGSTGGSIKALTANLSYDANGLLFGDNSSTKVEVTLTHLMKEGTVITATIYNADASKARGLNLLNSNGTSKATWTKTQAGDHVETYTVVADDGLDGSNVFQLQRNQNAYLKELKVSNCGTELIFHNLTSVVDPVGKGTVTLDANSVSEGHTTKATYSAIDPLYEFVSWSISGAGASIADATANPAIVTVGTEDAVVTLNLQLIPEKFTVNYYDDATLMGSEDVLLNEHPTAAGIAIKKQGYNFLGWSETNGGAVVELNTITSDVIATIPLYAKYETVDCSAPGNLFTWAYDPAATDITYNLTKTTSTENNDVEVVSEASVVTVSGGQAYLGTTSSSSTATVTNGVLAIRLNSNNYAKIVLDCPLQVGDKISYTATNNREHKFYKNAIAGDPVSSVSKQVMIDSDTHPLYGAEVLYVQGTNGDSEFKTFSIDRLAPVTGVSLTGATVAIGNTITPTMTLLPSNEAYYESIAWSIDGEGEGTIADIDAATGVVTALEAGTVTVQVKLNNSESLKATCQVEVVASFDQVDVSEATVWDVTKVSASPINLKDDFSPSKQNERLLLANVPGVNNNASFNSQALMFEGQHIGRVSNGIKHLAGRYVQFNVTVPGAVFVTFASNGNNNRTIRINDKKYEVGSDSETDYKTFAIAVEPGSVEIMGMEGSSENQYVRISKIEFKTGPAYDRTVNPAYLGTLCWKNNAVLVGATLYELAGKNASNYLVFDEVEGNALEAGKPYIFMPENGNTKIWLYNTDSEAALTTNQDPVNHMYGTIVDTDLYPTTDVNMYYFSSNHIWAVKDFTGVEKITVPAYFCYVDYEAVLADEPAPAPAYGRRRVTMGVNGKDAAQGFENILGGETPMKVMIDGTLYIIRGEKVFDATGRLVK